jgi:6-pyruvoyltetrahydropterin/6-carboxytetrahydropterin synthase
MYKITKEFHFSAGHRLVGLPPEHPCSNIHGHNYIVTVELESSALNAVGFIVDYRELQPIKDWIDTHFDHQFLNDKMTCNPTAENIAKILFTQFKLFFPQLRAVEVSETEKTKARYSQEYEEKEI